MDYENDEYTDDTVENMWIDYDRYINTGDLKDVFSDKNKKRPG